MPSPPASDPLHRLVYASLATTRQDSRRLRGILEDSRRRNRAQGITGVLLFRHGSYLQCLEGPRATVLATFERIRADARHRSLELLLDMPVAARAFAGWEMASAAVDAGWWMQLATADWEGPPTADRFDHLIAFDAAADRPSPPTGFELLLQAWEHARGSDTVGPDAPSPPAR